MTMTPLQQALLRQLTATQAGDPWYGASRAALLEGLTPEQAAARPFRDGHSIWQLVLHMTAWTREVHRRLGGAPPGEPEDGDWPAVGRVSVRGWNAARKGLIEAHAELIEAVRRLPAERWSQAVGENREPALGTGVDIGGMLIGLAQHDAYHVGQVAQLRKMV